MASADFFSLSLISLQGLLFLKKIYPQHGWRPPQVRVITFISSTCYI